LSIGLPERNGAKVRKLVALLVVTGLLAVGCGPTTPTGKPSTTPKTTPPSTTTPKTDSTMPPKTDTAPTHPEKKDEKKP
jgi:hypothetical protein